MIGAEETWEIATGRRAPLLGAGHGLEVGQPADFLLLRADAPELSFGELPPRSSMRRRARSCDTTVVAGRVLMRDGEVEGAGGGAGARDRARLDGSDCAAVPRPPLA